MRYSLTPPLVVEAAYLAASAPVGLPFHQPLVWVRLDHQMHDGAQTCTPGLAAPAFDLWFCPHYNIGS